MGGTKGGERVQPIALMGVTFGSAFSRPEVKKGNERPDDFGAFLGSNVATFKDIVADGPGHTAEQQTGAG